MLADLYNQLILASSIQQLDNYHMLLSTDFIKGTCETLVAHNKQQ